MFISIIYKKTDVLAQWLQRSIPCRGLNLVSPTRARFSASLPPLPLLESVSLPLGALAATEVLDPTSGGGSEGGTEVATVG